MVLSHGRRVAGVDEVLGVDGEGIDRREVGRQADMQDNTSKVSSKYFQIVGKFTDPESCPNLQFKPKMFFFQVMNVTPFSLFATPFSLFRPAEGGRSWSPPTPRSPRGPAGTSRAPTPRHDTTTSSLPAPPSQTLWPSGPPWMGVSLSDISVRSSRITLRRRHCKTCY